MNPLDHSFQRLLDAAAKARVEMPGPLPGSFEARVLAQWRTAGAEDEFLVLAGMFRRAAIFAALIMALSAGWNYLENRSDAGTTALASYAIKMQLPP
jgi:hypothetical protein